MECEFKWSIDDAAAFQRIAHSDTVTAWVKDEYTLTMDAAYYDSADARIAQMKGGLRLRKENGKGVVCLKLAAKSEYDGALKAREEYECEADEIREGLRELPKTGAPQDLCAYLADAELMELGRTAFIRQAYLLDSGAFSGELAFDLGEIVKENRKTPICEVELELKDGDKAAFEAFAMQIQKEFQLSPQPLSKLMRMRML